MGGWRFLLDENIDPRVATALEQEGIHCEHVRDALGPGAEDEADILPYARERELVIVTSDVTDFGALSIEDHAGIVLLFDDALPADRIIAGLIGMVEAYSSRETFSGREVLDAWT